MEEEKKLTKLSKFQAAKNAKKKAKKKAKKAEEKEEAAAPPPASATPVASKIEIEYVAGADAAAMEEGFEAFQSVFARRGVKKWSSNGAS